MIDRMYGVWVEMRRSDRQTDSVSVVLFMRSTGSVLLAAYARWGWCVFMTRASNGSSSIAKSAWPALHGVNNRKLVMAEFTAATRQSWNNVSVICWLNRSDLNIKAYLTSLLFSLSLDEWGVVSIELCLVLLSSSTCKCIWSLLLPFLTCNL